MGSHSGLGATSQKPIYQMSILLGPRPIQTKAHPLEHFPPYAYLCLSRVLEHPHSKRSPSAQVLTLAERMAGADEVHCKIQSPLHHDTASQTPTLGLVNAGINLTVCVPRL